MSSKDLASQDRASRSLANVPLNGVSLWAPSYLGVCGGGLATGKSLNTGLQRASRPLAVKW